MTESGWLRLGVSSALLFVVASLFFSFLALSCSQSAYSKRNKCVRKYLDYYTSGIEVTDGGEAKVGSVSRSATEKTTGINPEVQANIEDTQLAFKNIAALCLLKDADLVEYIFETEYQEPPE